MIKDTQQCPQGPVQIDWEVLVSDVTSLSDKPNLSYLFNRPYTDLFPNVSECNWTANGFLCHGSCLLADWCLVSTQKKSHRWGLAQVLLFPGLYHHLPVLRLHWHPACPLQRWALCLENLLLAQPSPVADWEGGDAPGNWLCLFIPAPCRLPMEIQGCQLQW